MPYATADDMIARFGEVDMIRLAAEEGQLDQVVNLARVGVAIDDATAMIDSYLRARYALPITPTPPELLDACCQLARWNLAQGEQKTPSDQMQSARRDVLAWLRLVMEGKVLLAGASPATAPQAASARFQGGTRDFGAGALL